MGRVEVLRNPLAQSVLTYLRDERTGYREFRGLLELAGVLEAYEFSRYLPVKEVTVRTPLSVKAKGVEVKDDETTIVAVMRAALPFAYGMLRVLPRARLGVVAAKRIEYENALDKNFEMEVEVPYINLPVNSGVLVLADPMLATGSTLKKVIELIRGRAEYEKLIVASVVSTELGIRRVWEAEPEAVVFTLAIDKELNEKAYIVPGLGDAGDRAFG